MITIIANNQLSKMIEDKVLEVVGACLSESRKEIDEKVWECQRIRHELDGRYNNELFINEVIHRINCKQLRRK